MAHMLFQLTSVNEEGEMELMDAVGTMNNSLSLPKNTVGEFTGSQFLQLGSQFLQLEPTLLVTTTFPFTELSERIMTKHKEVGENRAVFVTVLKAMDTEQVVDFIVKENGSS